MRIRPVDLNTYVRDVPDFPKPGIIFKDITPVLEHPEADLRIEQLARRVAMSPRNFARVFGRESGMTPAQFVERARVEAARRRLEEGPTTVEAIAVDCGFGSSETMRRAFQRQLRVSPTDYRARFRKRIA